MPKILVVDDSVTMRRVLEYTFAGQEGFEVVTFDNGDAALAAAGQGADLLIVDSSMSPDGYELGQRAKTNAATANVPVLLLTSTHHPVDPDRVKAAGIDEHVNKPFDSTTFIDKAKDVMSRPRRAPAAGAVAAGAVAAAPAAPPAAARPAAAPIPGVVRPAAPAPARPAASAPAPLGTPTTTAAIPLTTQKPAITKPVAKSPEPELLIDDDEPVITTEGAPTSATPAPAPQAPVARPRAVSTATAAATQAVASKLDGQGLSEEQIQAVLALTREVVERVVWEVVPDLAETLIREEIRRLTSA